MRKHKIAMLFLAGALAFGLSGCEDAGSPGYEDTGTYADSSQQESVQDEEYINEGTGNRTLADYVNEALEDSDDGTDGSGYGSEYDSNYGSGSSDSGSDYDGSSDSDYDSSSKNGQGQSETWEMRMARLAALEYSDGSPIAKKMNEGRPYFTEEEIAFAKNLAENDKLLDDAAYTEYDGLDGLGRTRTAYALLNHAMLPGDDVMRGSISQVKPTGWTQAKYEWIDNGGWLYNRCHLIAWSLTGENANEKNLMTGTRYFNTEGMLPYEIQVLKYLRKNQKNHIMYRATPVYAGSDLLAKGLLLEAWSVEDNGKLSVCAYIHNVQPGVDIDYATGESQMNEYMKILKERESK